VVILEASWLDGQVFGTDSVFSDSVRDAILTARG